MYISTTNEIHDKKVVKHVGLVKGSYLTSRQIGKELAAGLKSLVGRDMENYGALLRASRDAALKNMKDEAGKVGANAVIGVQLQTEIIMGVTAEFFAYGTAVIVED